MATLIPDKARELMQSARYIVALTGAGVSTPSGIPDFRSPTSGFWEQADPMEVASIQGFRRNPQAFYDWVRPLLMTTINARPNPAHAALAAMAVNGRLKTIITQNVDGLHAVAGSPDVVELHGHMRLATCQTCRREVAAGPILAMLVQNRAVPRCTCGGVFKPNIVLFGELLPYDAIQSAHQHAVACDLMIVAGSSLQVSPASELPCEAALSGAKLMIINFEPTPLDRWADVIIRGDVATVLPQLADAATYQGD